MARLSEGRQCHCRACSRLILVQLALLLLLLILPHIDTLVINLGGNESFTLKCSNNSLWCTRGNDTYTVVTRTQVLIDGQPTCDVTVRDSLSLDIQNHLDNVCKSTNETSNYALNLSNLSYLSNCTGVTTTSANVSFQAYYNCTSTKPTAFVTTHQSATILTASSRSPETTSDSEYVFSYQAGGATTNNASTNADQSAAEHDRRLTVILASVIPLLVILGAVALTIGVLARKNRAKFLRVLSSLRRRRGSSSLDSEPPITSRSSLPATDLTYASLHELGIEPDDHIYGHAVQQSCSNNSDAGEAVYENGPVHLPS